MNIEPNVGAVAQVLFRRRRLAFLTGLAVALLGAAYLIIATPKYRSVAAIVVRFDQTTVPNTDMAKETTPETLDANDRREIIQAHTDILANPDIARRVVETIGLGKMYPGLMAKPPAHGTPMDAAIVQFDKSLIADPELTGDVINLSFLHPDAKIAQAALSSLIGFYMRQEAELFSSSDFDFRQRQTEQALKRLTAAQEALRAYKEKWHITSFDDQVSDLIQERADLSANLHGSEVSLEQSQQHHDQLTRLLATVSPTVTNSASGEKYHSYDDAMANLAGLEQKEKEMMVTYRADSPLLSTLRASISASQADVDRRRNDMTRRDSTAPNTVYQSIQTDLLRATADAKAYAKSVEVQKAQLVSMDKQLGELEGARTGYNDRMREVTVADHAYLSLSLHLEDARVAESKLKSGISHGAVLTDPTLPYTIAKPRYAVLSVAIVMAAILASIVAAVGAELMDDRFTSSAQVARAFDLPVLARFEERG